MSPTKASLERARKWLRRWHSDQIGTPAWDYDATTLAAEFDAVREECAKVAEDRIRYADPKMSGGALVICNPDVAKIAAAIRKLGET